MFLHCDYRSQFLYLSSGNTQGIKKKNVGTFREHAFIPRMETMRDSKDAKMTKTGNKKENKMVCRNDPLEDPVESQRVVCPGLETVPKVRSFLSLNHIWPVSPQVNVKGKMR